MLWFKFDLGLIFFKVWFLFSFVPDNDNECEANKNKNKNEPGLKNFKSRTNLNRNKDIEHSRR